MKKRRKLFDLRRSIFTMFTCKQNRQSATETCEDGKIIMKTHGRRTTVYINTDVENISIDWGNGAIYDYNDGQFKILNDKIELLEFSYEYENETLHTIVITADNLQMLDCRNNQLTGLDASKYTELTGLDVSKCPKLNKLGHDDNVTVQR